MNARVLRLNSVTFGVCTVAVFAMGVSPCEGVQIDIGSSTCEYDGETYEYGDEFPDEDGCNDCECGVLGVVICTRRACTDKCEYDGELYSVGERWEIGDPECPGFCECQEDGLVMCAAPSCLDDCEYNGETYHVGDSFPAGDGCNTCSCTERGVVCTMLPCRVRCGGFAGLECPEPLVCEYGPECEGVSDCMGFCVERECPGVLCPLYCEFGFTDTDGDGCPDCACAEPCVRGGCSNQLCIRAGDEVGSTCEWLDEYACYRSAVCELQSDDTCGWTETDELNACLADARSGG